VTARTLGSRADRRPGNCRQYVGQLVGPDCTASGTLRSSQRHLRCNGSVASDDSENQKAPTDPVDGGSRDGSATSGDAAGTDLSSILRTIGSLTHEGVFAIRPIASPRPEGFGLELCERALRGV